MSKAKKIGPKSGAKSKKAAPHGRVIHKVNVDQSPVASQQFNIEAIPTLVLFVDGKAKGKIEGFTEAPQLVRWLARKSISPASDDSKNC